MNPQWHDEFVTLCALFPSGELTEEEWALLQVHLAYCDSCRVAFEEYQHLANDVMPVLAATAYSESENRADMPSFSMEAAEQRLMSQLDSVAPRQNSSQPRNTHWRIAAGTIAACALGAVCLIGPHFVRSKTQGGKQAIAATSNERAPKPSVAPSVEVQLRPELELAQHEVAKLQQQLSIAEDRFRESSSTVANIRQQLEAEQTERKQISDEKDALSQQLSVAQTEATSLRQKSAAAGVTAAQQAELENKIRELNASLGRRIGC